jgi:hypothetical protein
MPRSGKNKVAGGETSGTHSWPLRVEDAERSFWRTFCARTGTLDNQRLHVRLPSSCASGAIFEFQITLLYLNLEAHYIFLIIAGMSVRGISPKNTESQQLPRNFLGKPFTHFSS